MLYRSVYQIAASNSTKHEDRIYMYTKGIQSTARNIVQTYIHTIAQASLKERSFIQRMSQSNGGTRGGNVYFQLS